MSSPQEIDELGPHEEGELVAGGPVDAHLSRKEKEKLRRKAKEKAREKRKVEERSEYFEETGKNFAKFRRYQNNFIRHYWFSKWWMGIVNMNDEEDVYYTPGSIIGRQDFTAKLASLAVDALHELKHDKEKRILGLVSDDDFEPGLNYIWMEQAAHSWESEFKMWLNSRVFEDWRISEEGHAKWQAWKAVLERKQELAREWQGWFAHSTKGKESKVRESTILDHLEPVSDGNLRVFAHLTDISPLTNRIGRGTSGEVYKIKFLAERFRKELGPNDHYVAKRFKYDRRISPMLGHKNYLRELSACPVPHCGIVRPIAHYSNYRDPILIYPEWNGGHLEEMLLRMEGKHPSQKNEDLDTYDVPLDFVWKHRLEIFMRRRLELGLVLLESVSFMHRHRWLHNDLHARNILLHFPDWSFTKEGERIMDQKSTLVFIGIADFGWAQTFEDAADPSSSKYPHNEPNPGVHVAPELISKGWDPYSIGQKGNQDFSIFTDVYAIGKALRRMCWTFYDGPKSADFLEQLPGGPNNIQRLSNHLQSSIYTMTRGRNATEDPPACRKTAKDHVRWWREQLGVKAEACFRPLEMRSFT